MNASCCAPMSVVIIAFYLIVVIGVHQTFFSGRHFVVVRIVVMVQCSIADRFQLHQFFIKIYANFCMLSLLLLLDSVSD